MKNLPTIAGVIGIALIITSPLSAQAPSGSSATTAGSSPSASASEHSAAPAANGTSSTSSDASAPVTATAGSSAQAPSTVARPAVPTTSPVAPVTATTTTVTPVADVRATTQDPRNSLTRAPTQNTTATPGAVNDTASADAMRRDGGTSRRILGPGSSDSNAGAAPASATASTNDALTSVPPIGVSSTATVAYLRAVEPSQRTAALDRVEAQLADTNRAINRLPNSAPSAPATAQVDYAAAIQEVQAREAQLRSSLMTAQQSDEAGWAEARNRLASDYDAYIAATHRARAAAVNLDPTVAPAE